MLWVPKTILSVDRPKKKQKKTRHCVHTKENNNDFQNDSSITQLFFTAYNKYDFYL